MTTSYKIYNIFSPEGKLIQVENVLQSIDSCLPIVIIKSTDTICTISRKTFEKLVTHESSTFRINSKVYGTITGLPGDIQMVKHTIQTISASKEYSLGYEPTADIISRVYADKIQKLIQSTGTRQYAFALFVFGFDDESMVYYIDSSAVCYPFNAVAAGEHRQKMNNLLEKKYGGDILQVGLECIGTSLGLNYGPGDVEVCVLKKDEDLRYLNYEEIDEVLTKIHEME
ncbi:Proteasome subunit alpha type-6 [Conglomerata obtusa]